MHEGMHTALLSSHFRLCHVPLSRQAMPRKIQIHILACSPVISLDLCLLPARRPTPCARRAWRVVVNSEEAGEEEQNFPVRAASFRTSELFQWCQYWISGSWTLFGRSKCCDDFSPPRRRHWTCWLHTQATSTRKLADQKCDKREKTQKRGFLQGSPSCWKHIRHVCHFPPVSLSTSTRISHIRGFVPSVVAALYGLWSRAPAKLQKEQACAEPFVKCTATKQMARETAKKKMSREETRRNRKRRVNERS